MSPFRSGARSDQKAAKRLLGVDRVGSASGLKSSRPALLKER
jgi:hypothetical protein